MKICTEGRTRIVFVFQTVVVKVSRIYFSKIGRCFTRAVEHKKTNEFEVHLKKIHKNPFLAIIKYFLPGLQANRLEYLYSKKHPHTTGIIHVHGLLFGLIIFQKRGEVLDENDPAWRKVFKKLIEEGISDCDLLKSNNFCVLQNKIRLADYGSEFTQDALDFSALRIIENFTYA